MFDPRYTTIITGVAGELGVRLLPELREFLVYGVDLKTPVTECPVRFENIDVGRESCCRQLVNLLRETDASSVVHLAFMQEPKGTGAHHLQRMWQTNVAGTARVIEAITEVNRMGGAVRKLVFLSSALVYGPDLPVAAQEDTPMAARSLLWALHQQEADEVVQLRAGTMGGGVTTYILRPHSLTGTTSATWLISAFRGIPNGRGRLAERWRRQGKRLPVMVPRGATTDNRLQFAHVDDLARLIAWILRKSERTPGLNVLNVAGRDPALTLQRCAEMAGNRIMQGPRAVCRWALRLARSFGLSALPAAALPYMFGACTIDTARLRAFLAGDYEQVIQHSNEEALAASFRLPETRPAPEAENSFKVD